MKASLFTDICHVRLNFHEYEPQLPRKTIVHPACMRTTAQTREKNRRKQIHCHGMGVEKFFVTVAPMVKLVVKPLTSPHGCCQGVCFISVLY